jgi:AcrR family transcriptional regulator
MSDTTRRDRSRVDTDHEIRQVARTLLVDRGREAVTLRAIAREMGITAPALYRYYDSFEDLIQQVCADICTDLAAELATDIAAVPDDDQVGRVFAVCRGFRWWAIAHPREFSLVFASTAMPGEAVGDGSDPFSRIFLIVVASVLATRELIVPTEDEVPEALRADLAAFRGALLEALTETGTDLPGDRFPLGVAYTMLRTWVRLYGQVALEVFGRLPFVSDPEPLFESMLAELAVEVGLSQPPVTPPR